MKEPTQEDLLGYVLGALDAEQHQQIQELIDSDPQLDEKLLAVKSKIAPLEWLDENSGTRPGLARRTIELVANQSAVESVTVGPAKVAPFESTSTLDVLGRNSNWSMRDLLVAAASLAILASLLFPVVSYAKQQSNIIACSNNLRSIGTSLAAFSENNHGRFVEIPTDGPLSFAGIVAPILKEAQVIEDDNVFTCKAVSRDKPFLIPTTSQIKLCSTADQRDHFRKISSGDYGYSFGHMDGDKYVSPRSLGRSNVVIAADKPSTIEIGGPSQNHGGYGQNCLMEDFSVRFVKGNAIANDPIYVNAYNVVAPGVDARDSVIGASHLSPLSP
ncbi:MAG: hypothetical protein AAGA30_16795, partial [Planctomycetota bacterium]